MHYSVEGISISREVGWPPGVTSPTASPRKDDPWHGWRALATEDGRLCYTNVVDGRSQSVVFGKMLLVFG